MGRGQGRENDTAAGGDHPAGAAAGQAAAIRSEVVRTCRALQQRITTLERLLPFDHAPLFSEIRTRLHSDDLKSADLTLPAGGQVRLVYLQTLVNRQQLWSEVAKPLLAGTLQPPALPGVQPLTTWDALLHHLLQGTVLLLPEQGAPLGIALQGLQQRSVGKPSTERQVIGPKEAFVEKLDTNIGLIRNRLRDPALRAEYRTVGRRSRTRVVMLYLADVARPELVQLTRQGLQSIAVDFIRTAMDIAELTFQHGWTAFPLVEQTERPDRVAKLLAQGRLALVVEGMPFALVVPVTFWDFQHDGEDALPGPLTGLFARVLRYVGVFSALALPGLYVALLSVNVSILPARLALTLSAARLAIPYPVATESLIMLVLADVLAEATTQSASSIGNALAIVGTLIVGQLMVQADLASSLMMIVVAASVMGAFLTLKFSMSYAPRIWKYALVLLAAVGGLLGWFTGLLLLLVHLASLESAGVPYLAPLAGREGLGSARRIIVPSTRSRLRTRPAMLKPVQAVAARRGGRR